VKLETIIFTVKLSFLFNSETSVIHRYLYNKIWWYTWQRAVTMATWRTPKNGNAFSPLKLHIFIICS